MKIARSPEGKYSITPETKEEDMHLEWLLHRVFTSQHALRSDCGVAVARSPEPDPSLASKAGSFADHATAIQDCTIKVYQALKAEAAGSINCDQLWGTAERIVTTAIYTKSRPQLKGE